MAFSEVFLRSVGGARKRAFIGPTVGGLGPVSRVGDDVVLFDASVSEEHVITASIASHPVETGSDISDHYRANPEELTMNIVVSDTPIRFFSLVNPPGASVGDGLSTGKRSVDAYQRIRSFIDNAVLVDVFTTLNTYRNMAITNMGVTRDASTGNALHATIGFRQVVTVDTDTQQIKPKASPENKTRAARSDVGIRPPPNSNAANAEASATILANF